jgi:outer membrane protein assembly factor BamB
VIRGAATAHRPGQADFGTSMGDAPGYSGTGSVTAVDVATGEIRWQTPLPSPPLGGVTATAGGVVLVGTVAGQMYGLDAQTGAISWLAPVGANIGTAPIVYRSGAGVYVVVTTGGGGMSGAARIDAVQAWRLP